MADKSISELVAATSVGSTDLFVLEQANTAKKLTGQILENWLVSFADGHGGIQSWSYTPPVAPSLEGTLTLTLADTTVITVPIMNGAKGDTGAQTYVWIRWAAQEPTADNQLSTTPDAWIGIYVGLSPTAPTTRGSYAWYQYKGAQGDQGDQGESIATVIQTGGDGSPGSTDTYTITLTDGTVAGQFDVYNGQDGQGAPGSQTPLVDSGTGSAGTATAYARENHVHPYPPVIHSGPSAPANADVQLWLDTDEPGETAVTSVNGQTGAVTIPTFSTQEITLNTTDWTMNQTRCFVIGKYVFVSFYVQGTPTVNRTIATGLPVPKLIGNVSPITAAGSTPSIIAVNTSGTLFISSAGNGAIIGGVLCYEAE